MSNRRQWQLLNFNSPEESDAIRIDRLRLDRRRCGGCKRARGSGGGRNDRHRGSPPDGGGKKSPHGGYILQLGGKPTPPPTERDQKKDREGKRVDIGGGRIN